MKRSSEEARGPLEREARVVLRDAGVALKRLESSCARAVAAATEAVISSLARQMSAWSGASWALGSPNVVAAISASVRPARRPSCSCWWRSLRRFAASCNN